MPVYISWNKCRLFKSRTLGVEEIPRPGPILHSGCVTMLHRLFSNLLSTHTLVKEYVYISLHWREYEKRSWIGQTRPDSLVEYPLENGFNQTFHRLSSSLEDCVCLATWAYIPLQVLLLGVNESLRWAISLLVPGPLFKDERTRLVAVFSIPSRSSYTCVLIFIGVY
jgi:hypothetical protein